MSKRVNQEAGSKRVTFLVTAGWGSNPKFWVRAKLGIGAVPKSALTNVGWGTQVLEADRDPFTAMFWVPESSALAIGRYDLPEFSPSAAELNGKKMIWPDSGLGCRMGSYPRRAFRDLDTALALLVATYRDCGFEMRVLDCRELGGGFA